MDIRYAIYRVWELAGEPTDLDPWIDTMVNYDPYTEIDENSRGVRDILEILSEAQIRLANWKTNNDRPIHFRNLKSVRNVRLTPTQQTYSCSVLNTTTIRITAPPSWMTNEILESCRCDVTQTGFDSNGGATTAEDTLMAMFIEREATGAYLDIYFREELTEVATVTSAEVNLIFDRFTLVNGTPTVNTPYFLMPTAFKNLLKITDAENSSPLTRAAHKTHLYNPDMSTGTPSEWYQLGKRVFFDVYFEEPRWFVVEYQKEPDVLSSVDQEFEIPAAWHEVLIEMAMYIMAERDRENEMLAVRFSNINRLIARLRTDHEDDWLRDNGGGTKIRMS